LDGSDAKHQLKFTFGLQLLLQVEVFESKCSPSPSCGPDNVQTTIQAEVIVRQFRRTRLFLELELEKRKRIAGLF